MSDYNPGVLGGGKKVRPLSELSEAEQWQRIVQARIRYAECTRGVIFCKAPQENLISLQRLSPEKKKVIWRELKTKRPEYAESLKVLFADPIHKQLMETFGAEVVIEDPRTNDA